MLSCTRRRSPPAQRATRREPRFCDLCGWPPQRQPQRPQKAHNRATCAVGLAVSCQLPAVSLQPQGEPTGGASRT
jgi:hypothetical protein